MANEVNIYTPRYLAEVVRLAPPVHTYFRDTFFTNVKTFATERVDIDLVKGDRRMAAFVHPRAGGQVLRETGYETQSYKPPLINPYDLTTADRLMARLPGEDMYSGMTPAQRAAEKLIDEYNRLNDAATRREEWMAVQTMLNNECTMQTFIDDKTKGEKLHVQFFEGSASEHIYTPAKPWTSFAEMRADVIAMCRMLSYRGLPVTDLLLGTDTADAILQFEDLQRLLDKNSGIAIGSIREQLTAYTGVVLLGVLNFGGFPLNLISVEESYMDDDGPNKPYFPKTGAMVTAPACGHFMYGQITQIDYGSTVPISHPGVRVPKFTLDQDNDMRKLRLATRPLAAPKNYCPYIYAADVVS